MGLDLIELTFAIEDAFGIYIPNDEAERLETPGQVVDYFVARLVPGASPACLSQRAFHRLRAAGMQVLGRPRGAFTPETSWCDLLHPEQRHRQWELLASTVKARPWPAAPILWRSGHSPTVGETARFLAERAPHILFGPGEGWSRAQVEATVAHLIREDLGIPSFEWHHHFVKDLGCG